MVTFQYNLLAVGGTFDRFHDGHKTLLTSAFLYGKNVVIGITSDIMVKEKTLSGTIESYKIRRDSVMNFLTQNNLLLRSQIVEIKDPYGPLLRRKDIEAIVVGPKFSKEAVNLLKKHVAVIHCPIVHTKKSRYLSSTEIRKGHIDRSGNAYAFSSQTLKLPEKARTYLKKPLGILLSSFIPSNKPKPLITIAVGDETVRTFISNNQVPDLSIVDFYVQRKKVYSSIDELGMPKNTKVTIVKNTAGTLTSALARAVKKSLDRITTSSQKEVIRVIGEEDLATLLCILFAPLTSRVYYGQPHEGMVEVEVTEKKKEEISKLLSTFTPLNRSATIM